MRLIDYPNSPRKRERKACGRPGDLDAKTAQNNIKSLDRAMKIFEVLSAAQGKALSALPAAQEPAAAIGGGPIARSL